MTLPGRVAPRFVPTLTEVVQIAAPPADSPPRLPENPLPDPVAAPGTTVSGGGAPNEIDIHRIMQRVDLSLEARLRAAVLRVVSEQVEAMGPQLRDEIELAVRDAVSQAVAEELAVSRTTNPAT